MLIPIRYNEELHAWSRTFKPLERARMAAISIKHQKRVLRLARQADGDRRRMWLRSWHYHRLHWAHLVGVAR